MLSSVDIFKAPFRQYKKHVWKVGPMAANPYATHVPVLVACAELFKPVRILELGSGVHSTPLFLDRKIFPQVEYLCSLENDPRWFRQMEGLQDSRLERVLMNGQMSDALRTFDCEGFDLIFVDDSTHARYRQQTLDALRRKVTGQIVVVHDVDQWRVRLGARALPHHYEMLALTPQSSVAWNTGCVSLEALTKADNIMRVNKSRVPEDQALRWRDLFRNALSRD
jgi:hypothetical protein